VSGSSEATLGGATATNNRLGSVLAAGEIDADGVAELAVGVPDANVAGEIDAGRVYLTRRLDLRWIFGDGFESGGSTLWSAVAP
jgi:hypothetical protein